MKVLLTSATAFFCLLAFSCKKHSTPPDAGAGPNSLFPLVQGSIWYYSDSAFSDSAVTAAYPDTMTLSRQTYVDQNGTTYLEMNDQYGWFDGSYISVDPSNVAIYEVDSPYFQPYTFFAVPTSDGAVIGTGSDFSNPACALTTTQYGWVTPVMIGSYSCLKNIEYTVDCNSNPQEEIDSYVCEGTGVVRIVHYLPDSTNGGPLHEDYSQTLTSAVIK